MRPNDSILKDLSRRIHKCAVEHGWWESGRTWGECMALVHSEIAEATEELRNAEPLILGEREGKPDGVVVELADAVIRLLDACERFEVDVVTELANFRSPVMTYGWAPLHRMAIIHASVPLPIIDGFRASESAMMVATCEGVATSFGHDLWPAVQAKHAYNLTRPYKHGRAA